VGSTLYQSWDTLCTFPKSGRMVLKFWCGWLIETMEERIFHF
jgi:hypothetical protein